ncbi:protein translocase subunit SecD [Allokutzneria sp. A3M-2-11 16]|uniref:protein translocase subunit SecD n=1 Tax=Allokutzneria sp. A3M-2-11 16 TaxID=2962043 RepID=UPI0020B88FDF|nr:protein translocase subunit SecD [Allokutzneria sp. A3M-2-11 16]MCP3801344.1 protein translocase subunit SecD [Allokutzneria sp. A3M-2-11 16]
MAPPAGHIRPGRYLGAFILIVGFLYSLVFFTGDGRPVPKLGIDLQGGTRVTLTVRSTDGAQPPPESIDRARQIIEQRVNGMGVSGAEVVRDGNNLVITVPGERGDEAKTLGRTADLNFRPVLQAVPNQPLPPQTPPTGGQPPASGTPPTSTPPPNAGTPPTSQPKPQGRPAPAAEQQQPNPTPPTGTAPAPGSAADAVAKARALRQSEDPQVQAQALALLDCTAADPLRGLDKPELPLVTCSDDNSEKFVLGKVFLPGREISDAAAGQDQNSPGYVISVNFRPVGSDIWSKFTSANVGKRAAFVLDGRVVSAPNINEPILGGNTQISGRFTLAEAQDLANILKYGSLPLAFDQSEAETVSATLGLASMQAGLIAGAIGLVLVFGYCMFYYRALGVLTVLSLGLAAAVIYSVLVLLGRWIGFTLDLAGIAGFIVAIGITADSFIVFFERLKDEVREGRTFRSAVPRGWIRARRTILSADAVSFMAAAVLYILAVGQVKGFAFTLGMSTVLDLVVVFLVTHPLVALASQSKLLSKPAWSGLGEAHRTAAASRSMAKTSGSPAAKGV